MLRIAAALLCLTLAAPAVDLNGTWNVVMPADTQKRPDGGTSTWKEVRGVLVMSQTGSQLTATWRALDEWTLKGRVDEEGRVALESEEREIPGTRNGKTASVRARWVMRGALKDGVLAGTAALVVGDKDPIFHKWTATRSTSR